MAGTWSPMDVISRENVNGITVQFSCFSKLGDGRWAGTVVFKNGPEVEVEELATSWRVTPGTGTSVTERSLEQALKKALLKKAS